MNELFFAQLQQATEVARHHMLNAPIFAACQRGDIDLPSYQAFLTQAYHHVKHTVPLLMACGSRLKERDEWMQAPLAEYIEEEQGHHLWILDDLKVCGADIRAVQQNAGIGRVCAPIELMVAYLYYQIDRHNPLALFGMVWVLEGTSVGVGGAMADLIQQHLQLPDEAMSYLRSHSSLDQQHIKLFAGLMDKITDKRDQQVIIDSANMVFALYGQMLAQIRPIQEGV
ncbi:TenA family transcriptional regulator [Celerinatantimonas yamalensis]|uniref:Iron-containing redox enzyme family protein n=1 Tax=Celerinatantimonas yamalensis TaxID=559956 RepID=A0ABW9G4E7_9GAMM